MSDNNKAVTWRIVAYGFATISQALVMFLLWLIFQQLINMNDRQNTFATDLSRLEGVVSQMNTYPVAKHEENGKN